MGQTDSKFEVVICDNLSRDGAQDILRNYRNSGKIKLVEKKSNRGQGRQFAFESSTGTYIIANMDTDDTYLDGSIEIVLRFYHKHCEGKMLTVQSNTPWVQNVTIAPRALLIKLGGWRDLSDSEDWDLWARAAKIGMYRWTIFDMVGQFNRHTERKSLLGKLKMKLIRYRDWMRLKRKLDLTWKGGIVKFLAALTLPFYPSYRDSFNESFDYTSKEYFVKFEPVL